MTSITYFMNSNLQTTLINNDTLNKILSIDTNNNINYMDNTAINPFNQSLNTTNSVTFNALTLSNLNGTNNILIFSNVTKYWNTITTSNSNATTMLNIATINNSNYYITVEISAFCKSGTLVNTGGSYRQTKRVTNFSGVLSLSSNLENLSSTTIIGSSINITSSGTNIIIQVTGVISNTIDWIVYARTIVSS